jgi:heme A synthase
MKWLAPLMILDALVGILVFSLGVPIYRWEMIASLAGLIVWVCVAWFYWRDES